MPSRSLEFYLSLSYNVHITKKGEQFYLYIPELPIVVQDTDLTRGHARLEEAKDSLLKQYHELGREHAIPLPAETIEGHRLVKAMLPFVLKVAVVCLAVVLMIVTINVSVIYILQEGSEAVVKSAGRKVNRTFLNLADKGLNPETAARYHRDLRAIVRILKPFAEDLRPLFAWDSQAPRKQL